MRHHSIETKMDYYVDQDADDVVAELWGTEFGSTFGSTPQKRPPLLGDRNDANRYHF